MDTTFQWFGLLTSLYLIILCELIIYRYKPYGHILIYLCVLNIFYCLTGFIDGGKFYYLGSLTTPDILFYLQVLFTGFQYGHKRFLYSNNFNLLDNKANNNHIVAISKEKKC